MKVAFLLLWIAACAPAADFWQWKPFTAWSPREIGKLERASPWAHRYLIWRGIPCCGSYADSWVVTVSWQSARPLREALARERFGDQAATSHEAQAIIDEEPEFFQILVTVAPGTPFPTALRRVLESAVLTVRGRSPLHAVNFETGGDGGKARILFLFPRRPLSVSDRSVTFSANFGLYAVRQTFRLRDMVYRGRLEL